MSDRTAAGTTGVPSYRIELGRRIRQLREERSWSQEQLAEKARNMDRSYLAEVETGVANPSVDVLFRIATALDVSLVQLFVPN